MEKAAELAPDVAEVHYDLAVIRLANKDFDGAIEALTHAIDLNPKLRKQAREDGDMDALRDDSRFPSVIE
jgi:Flp pilus assembly protein TadD